MTSAKKTGGADPAAQVSKLSYVTFDTPDVERMVWYYTQVLDFAVVEQSADEAFLTTGADHHSVVIKKGDLKARSAVGYEIWDSLTDAQRRLENAGYQVERRSDVAPGTPDVVLMREPGTGVELHLIESQVQSGVDGRAPLRPTKLGHVAAFTPELDRLQNFYQDLLGFKWSDTIGDFFVFLRCNADHHAANFMASTKKVGMHHIAYEMRDPNHLITMVDHLAKNEFRLHWGPGRHGPGHNLFTYHKDPDGHTIELFTQLDVIHDESKGYWEPRPWHETYPQYPRTWEVDVATVNIWGPINEQEMEH
ncbi:glyoxalase [Rhodococcoides fascians A21d2]|uniref:VOC family protein n=1 Tax=Rhodococcoides fascians TaxID=1828 RepID=UPI0005653CD3|nr:VOC family protein [Rhodococcus fascians]QII00309.1 glyoxalase [Rhodococcus fascians A21d2]